MRVELRTPNGTFGTVSETGADDEATAKFLEGLVMQGGIQPGDPGYTRALYDLLRSGTYLWAQPISDGGI